MMYTMPKIKISCLIEEEAGHNFNKIKKMIKHKQ